jgi:hypothetical protein
MEYWPPHKDVSAQSRRPWTLHHQGHASITSQYSIFLGLPFKAITFIKLIPTSFYLVINRLNQRRLVLFELFLHLLDALAFHLETAHFLLQGFHLGDMVLDLSAIDHIIVPADKFLGIYGKEHLFQYRHLAKRAPALVGMNQLHPIGEYLVADERHFLIRKIHYRVPGGVANSEIIELNTFRANLYIQYVLVGYAV